jgi:chitinase
MYGRSFTLTTPDTGLGAPAKQGNPSPHTNEAGYASYHEVCEMIKKNASIYRMSDQKVPYLIYNNQWVGYDDPVSLREKVNYVRTKGYAGVMIWALDLDDFGGHYCGAGKYPLLSAMNDECMLKT